MKMRRYTSTVIAAWALLGCVNVLAQAPDTLTADSRMPSLLIGGEANADVYLQSLDISVEVMGAVASTRYTMVFKNWTNRNVEGELTFPLPDGSTVTHYALDINGKMREAVAVEKAEATRIFEEIQQREVDPGILERVEGNNFRTRIYPFPAGGTRTVTIGYEEELPLENGMLHYRLPMAYRNTLDKFSVKATVLKSELEPIVPESKNAIRFDKAGENYVASFTRRDHRPDRALIFALPAPADIPRIIMQNAECKMQNATSKSKPNSKSGDSCYYFLASVAPEIDSRKKVWENEIAIIWDVSMSGLDRDLKREIEMLDIIFKEKKNADVHLHFLNNRFKKVANRNSPGGMFKVSGGKWDALKKTLQTAIYDGGTDYSQIKLSDIKGKEVLFFSDGLSTLSDADLFKNGQAERLRLPIHCIVSSATADYGMMRLIASKSGGEERQAFQKNLIDNAVAAADRIQKWWDTDYPYPEPPEPDPDDSLRREGKREEKRRGIPGSNYGHGYGYESGYGDGSGGGIGELGGFVGDAGSGLDLKKRGYNTPIIRIKPLRDDNGYFKQMTGKTAQDYQTYLKLREVYGGTPTFYFDMSRWFYLRKDKETALRILTSIADMTLENESLYRLLGYRFKEYGEHALQMFVCKKVIEWRPLDPQSYRDYALALADAGHAQVALDSLYGVLTRPYSSLNIGRSSGIEEAVIMEMNHLINKNPELKTSHIDKRLLLKTPVDVRVVINWNMNYVDIDLYVIDPNFEESSHMSQLNKMDDYRFEADSNRHKIPATKIGGRISDNITSG